MFKTALSAIALLGLLAAPTLACDKCANKDKKNKSESHKECKCKSKEECKCSKHDKAKADTVKPAKTEAPCSEPKAGEEGACKM